ncbi:pimeloyl-ACP methyl ester carboxylesterase [Saccharothrix ecbatanensis]|uniref:Pimeloyl-ACP methyl ester carboxylesterase n=1 Tax=Saccharothrix ecbatanensis TaxID=1105145 RepID=A0A7W9HK99_9PSEU|nr:alpha/beta hydrolase [Saccharothrix ecbatanensis]MBB5803857.1 pimeloyl-ACP methyl ester carboxylesterase [Saccharothrix ecbatanensis]
MLKSVRRFARFTGRLGLSAVAVLGLVVLLLALLVLTDGAAYGLLAWLATLGVGAAVAVWRARRRAGSRRWVPFLPVILAVALAAVVCIPSAPTDRVKPAALPFVTTQQWSLATGSRVAVYHYPPTGSARRATPLVYLHGGPVRSISVLDHRFLQLLARQGYDVYAYEQAGGGRSDLLPMDQYGISRSVRDLAAFIDHLDQGQVDVLGFSSGAVILTRALAEPDVATRVHKAIIAEPGPMDGPTAQATGQQGRPNARNLGPAMSGPRATRIPRYAVAFGLMRLGLLSPETGLIGQAEGANAFEAADLGSDTASAYCAQDAHRIPAEDTPGNFSFSAAASLRIQETIKDSPSIAPQLARSTVPAMLMIAECSSQTRQWATAILDGNPAIDRTQYLPGVGHHMWNGLDNNDETAGAVVDAFLQDKAAPLPNYPTRTDVPAFLQERR